MSFIQRFHCISITDSSPQFLPAIILVTNSNVDTTGIIAGTLAALVLGVILALVVVVGTITYKHRKYQMKLNDGR